MSNNNRAPVSASENFLEGGLIEINGEIVEDIAQILIHNLVAKDDIHLRPIIRETMKTVWMIAEMRRRNLHLFKKSEEGRKVECDSPASCNAPDASGLDHKGCPVHDKDAKSDALRSWAKGNAP